MKKKSPKEKEELGTTDPRRDLVVKPDTSVIANEVKPMPGILTAQGKRVFDAINMHLEGNDVRYGVDKYAMTQFAWWMERWISITTEINKDPSLMYSQRSTQYGITKQMSPELQILVKAEEVLRRYYLLFGITPLAREKIIAFLERGSADPEKDPVAEAMRAIPGASKQK